MIVTELLDVFPTHKHVALTKAMKRQFEEYLFNYNIVMPVMEYLEYLENQGKIHVFTLPNGITKIQRLYP